jgi:hypothetical protein
MLRGRPLAGQRAFLGDLRSTRAGACPGGAGIPDCEFRLIATARHPFTVEVRETSLRAGLEWLARRPDVGVGPLPSAVGGAVEGSVDARDGMPRAGSSAVVATRTTRARITPTDDRSNP